ncbi:uncharacterized protein LOC108733220 [Agrilus planipennis]|uniref:Uncharacterized protein LOC108733220 n=1 Tax=Agrilus planipennis TaxID=224129 RepID=A0A1W4WI83_AGRPL|nr:uncharacterized protein LOC108733220 [Agrilus planipennis]
MNSFALAVFCALLSVSTASWWGGYPSTLTSSVLLKNPSLATTVIGYDGGVVSEKIVPGYSAHTVPLVTPIITQSAPIFAQAPLLSYGSVAHVAPLPLKTGTLIDGPSGTIKTSGSANGLIASTIY